MKGPKLKLDAELDLRSPDITFDYRSSEFPGSEDITDEGAWKFQLEDNLVSLVDEYGQSMTTEIAAGRLLDELIQ